MDVMLLRRMWSLVLVLGLVLAMSSARASGSSWAWSTFASPVSGNSERVVRVSVRVEAGLALDAENVAATVSAILGDERGWVSSEDVAFQIVVDDDPDLLVSIATPATTDHLCLPLNTVGKLSCRRGGQVILNVDRWERGPDVYHSSYDGHLDEYRRYLVNHEVGHFLGKGHVRPASCSSTVRAPVMMQQTFGLKGCAINGWPTLDGATAGPTAMQRSSIAAAVRDLQLVLSPWFTQSPLRR